MISGKILKKEETKITADPGKQEIFISRVFKAPRELVFRAFTDPKLLVQWFGPKDLTLTVEKSEMRKGGSYRYIHTDKNGNEFKFNGVVHDLAAPEKIIDTFEFEGEKESGHVALEITTFEGLAGNKTRMDQHTIFQSVEDRDGMIQADMKRGVLESHERLDWLLEEGLSL